MTTEAEIGVRQPQARERLEPSEAGRDQEGFFPRGFGGAEVHLIRLLASGTLREYISVGLSLP